MPILFEIIKVVFLMLTIVVGLTYSGGLGIDGTMLATIKQALMPGYLISIGLIIGYIVAEMLALRHDEYHRGSWVRGFAIGLSMGFILALLYVVI